MPDAQPKCVNIDCGQILFVDEEDWEKDSPGFEMGERIAIITCPDCGTKNRVEKFTEVSYVTMEVDDEDEEKESERPKE